MSNQTRPNGRPAPRRRALAILAGAALAAMTAPRAATAQNALGTGRALDANPRVGSGGVNERGRDLSSELQFRNAIVSGNAPGAMSFRGDVGYTSPFEFRGELGSDDLFGFRRDAFFSGVAAGPAGQRLRGVDALQFQMGMSLAGSFDGGAMTPILTRTRAPNPGGAQPQTISLDDGTTNYFDPISARDGALRSASEFLVGDALSPKVLSTSRTESGETRYLLASPLRSISPDRAPSGVSPLIRPDRREATTPENATGGDAGARVSGRIEPLRASSQIILDTLRARPGDDAAEEDRPEGAPARPQAPGGDAFEPLEQRLERLRRELEGAQQPATDENPDAQDDPQEQETQRDAVARLTRQALGDRRAEVRALAPPPDESRNFFTEHMHRGQEMLAADRWFEAEERFTSAALMRPGDVFAQAGRIHAQLGAGLYRSAGENLKQLIRSHPEMLAVRFNAALLPRDQRLTRIAGELRNRAVENSQFGRDAALLLAYLGAQHDEREYLVEAFEAIDRISGELGEPDPVFEAARAAWLDDR